MTKFNHAFDFAAGMTRIYAWWYDDMIYVLGYTRGDIVHWFNRHGDIWENEPIHNDSHGMWRPMDEYGKMSIEDAKKLIVVLSKMKTLNDVH